MTCNRSRNVIAARVARHWTRAIMADMDAFHHSAVATHSLGCVRAALAGVTDPNQLGIAEGSDARFIRRAAQRYADV